MGVLGGHWILAVQGNWEKGWGRGGEVDFGRVRVRLKGI